MKTSERIKSLERTFKIQETWFREGRFKINKRKHLLVFLELTTTLQLEPMRAETVGFVVRITQMWMWSVLQIIWNCCG